MISASQEFRSALAQSHPIFVRVDLLVDNVVTQTIPITGGSVRVDRGSASVRSATLEVVDPTGDITPDDPFDPLAPYGNEVRVWYGVGVYPQTLVSGTIATYAKAGSMEMVPLATCRISRVEVSDDGSPTVSVETYDRARTVSRNKFTAPYIIAAGTNYVTAIVAMIQDRLPGVDTNVPDSVTDTTPLIVIDPESDPWEEIGKMATTIGYEAYFDGQGTFTMTQVPDLTNAPIDWVYKDGENSMIASLDRDMDDDPGYNGVVLTAESTTLPAPLRSEVWDLNPSSPTYANGKYGRVPKFVTSPYPTTQAQADTFATIELRNSAGGTEGLSITALPNPLHEPNDVVLAQRGSRAYTVLVDSFTIPLSPTELMPLATRRRRSLS